MHVADLFRERPARQLEALWLCVVRASRSAGCASLALGLMADERLSAQLRRQGFLWRPQARSFVVHPLGLGGAEIEAVTDPQRWHIIDGDLDI